MLACCLSLATGCASIEVRGAFVEPRGLEPRAEVKRGYAPDACVDGVGQPAGLRIARAWLVEGADGRLALVRTEPGYDSLVIVNSFEEGEEWVFQASFGAARNGDVLFDYRLPKRGEGPARMAIVRTWQEERNPDGSFRAHFERPALVCRLEPFRLVPWQRFDEKSPSEPDARAGN